MFPAGTVARKLVDHAVSIGTAGGGRTVKVAVSIEGHACLRIDAIVPAGEIVERDLSPLVPGLLFLKDCAIPKGTPQVGRSIEIARRIQDHSAKGLSPVGSAAKLVDLNFLPLAGADLKVTAKVSPSLRGSEEGAVGAQGQRPKAWAGPVGWTIEAV